MGRTRTKSKKAPRVESELASATANEAPTLVSLLTKAHSLVAQCDYDLAQSFVRKIIDRDPGHAEAKELLGIIQLEMGDVGEAAQTFRSLIPPAPGAPNPPPPSAHLYLAQLSEDDPRLALEHYQAAIELLFGQLKGKEPARDSGHPNEGDIKNNIVRVLIAMVEIWMAPTYDLCFDPKAEETCEALLNTAFSTDPDNIEALICQSSLRLSQQRQEEAKYCATKAWLAWKDLDADDALVPPISTRIELTKRFLELSEYEAALLVLQSIMATDDQEVEAWYLEGWCFFLMAEQAKESGEKVHDLSWEELAKDGRDCLENCRLLHTNQEHPDDKLLEHTEELICQLDSLGIKPSPEAEDGDGNGDEGWEDMSDNEDDDDVEMG